MKLCCRRVFLCSIALIFGLCGVDRVSVKAFADDVVLISTTILPAGQTGVYYSALVVPGDGAAPFQFYITSGSLPSGLSLNSGNGAISGTPTSAGAFSFTAGITDEEGFSATANLSIVINPDSRGNSPTYGPGVGADGLGNTRIGPWQLEVSNRFTATHTGPLQQATVYLIPDASGYAGGTGGTIQVTINTDDGTSAHNPGSTTLATYYISGAASLPAPQRYIYVMKFSNSPTLNAGQIYHMVFQNVDSSPQNNFISVDSLYQATPESSLPPSPKDPNAAVLMAASGEPWAPRPGYSPIYQLDYQDGASQGIGYVAGWVGAAQNISGTKPLRETFTVSGSQINVNSAAIRVLRSSGDDPLRIQLQDANGVALADGYVDASSIPLSNPDSPIDAWSILPFASTVTLVPGKTYHLVFECTSTSTYQAFPIQKGAYYGFKSTTFFPDGSAEVKVNDSWTGWTQWGTSNRTDDDLQFYFTVVQ